MEAKKTSKAIKDKYTKAENIKNKNLSWKYEVIRKNNHDSNDGNS